MESKIPDPPSDDDELEEEELPCYVQGEQDEYSNPIEVVDRNSFRMKMLWNLVCSTLMRPDWRDWIPISGAQYPRMKFNIQAIAEPSILQRRLLVVYVGASSNKKSIEYYFFRKTL